MSKEWICKEEITGGIGIRTEYVPKRELIRCKDCKWWHHNSTCYNEKVRFGCYRKADWFCADGERKDDG